VDDTTNVEVASITHFHSLRTKAFKFLGVQGKKRLGLFTCSFAIANASLFSHMCHEGIGNEENGNVTKFTKSQM
jgi:hypothetical protein